MRLLPAGGRHLTDAGPVTRALGRAAARHAVTVPIRGGHPVTGPAAEGGARRHDPHVLHHPPNLQRHGHRARRRRSALMPADGRPDLVLALQGGADTAALIARVRAMGLQVLQADPDDPGAGAEEPRGRCAWPRLRPAIHRPVTLPFREETPHVHADPCPDRLAFCR